MRDTRRLGVRGRVQLAFAVGGLLVSVFLAAVSWSLTTTYLHNQRELTATRNALVSADLLDRRLAAQDPVTVQALQQSAGLGNDALYLPPRPAASSSERDGVSTTPRLQPTDLPSALVELAAGGTAAQQRVVVNGRPSLAVALPVGPAGAVYVELFPLTVLDRTLRGLSFVLAVTAALATLLAAALGRWATQRTLRPLRALVTAAEQVAHGALDTRVDAHRDPDLLPLAEAFNSTTAALRERVARDARFASDVSHELRSPVTTMVNAAELLQNRRSELSAAGQEALELLHDEVRRFGTLVTDLLEVSRDDQLLEVHLEPVRLGSLVRHVADRRAGHPVTHVAPDAADVLVEGDRRRLERVVANLVDNAGLHGGEVRDVTVERVGECLRLTVRDAGPGVSPGDRDRIFDRFFRGAASRVGVPGSGLGLPIVAQHVHAHGGRVWVQDAPPRGAAFVVELPVAVEQA
jgi:two-component system sensor histidine kinase MtrB